MAKETDKSPETQIKALEDAAFERGRMEGLNGVAVIVEHKMAEAKAQGAELERERIRAVEAQALPGHEALINELKFDGHTTGPEAAQRVLAAEKTKRERVLQNIKTDAIAPVPAAAAPPDPGGAEKDLPPEEQAKAKWNRSPEIREEFGGNLTAYLAFTNAETAGRVRILSKARQ